MSWWSRCRNVWRSGRVEGELDEELQFHLEERTRALIEDGMTREAAAAEATRRLGNALLLRERSRDVKLLPWLDSLVRDARYATRSLRKHASVTTVAVVSLTLALGACIASASLIEALVFRPLAVHEPSRLIYLAFPTYVPDRPESETFSDPLFERLREAAIGRAALFAVSTQVIHAVTFAGGNGEKERVRTQYLSGDAFERLGLQPAVGRLIDRTDDQRTSDPVAVVSHAFWTRRFGGAPSAIGHTLTHNSRTYQIVGVTQPGFIGLEPGRPTDVWFPYYTYNPRSFGNAEHNWFRIFGRLEPNVSRSEAEQVLSAAFMGFRREYAERLGGSRTPEALARFISAPLYVHSAANGPSPIRRQYQQSLWILGGIAALVLLIAAANVANLYLARGTARAREMALRLSIGAGRGRLIQQMLVESALVATLACVLGLLFATVSAPVIVSMLASPDDPVALDLRPNGIVLTIALLLTVLTTLAFGLAPALRASAVEPLAALNQGGSRIATRIGALRPLVAAQFAFGLVVVFLGGLLVLSFVRLSRVDPGFATSDVLLVSVEAVERAEARLQRTALLALLDRVRTVPGVQAVGTGEFGALGRPWTHNIRPPHSPDQSIETTMAPVSAGYLEAMGIPLVAGRAFRAADIDPPAPVVIVNEAFASRYFGREVAVGKTVGTRFGSDSDPAVHEVIGVVSNTKYDLRQSPAPTIYIPIPLRALGTIHVRGSGDLTALSMRLREVVRSGPPLFRVRSITTQTDAIFQTMLRERLLALLSGFFGVVGLTLAAIGLYGVLSYTVVQRTKEIGVRMALGAGQGQVVRSILKGVGSAAAIGVVCGLGGAMYLSQFVRTLLFEVTPLDFWSLALPLGALTIVAVLASTIPGVRASRVDPVVALRQD